MHARLTQICAGLRSYVHVHGMFICVCVCVCVCVHLFILCVCVCAKQVGQSLVTWLAQLLLHLLHLLVISVEDRVSQCGQEAS